MIGSLELIPCSEDIRVMFNWYLTGKIDLGGDHDAHLADLDGAGSKPAFRAL